MSHYFYHEAFDFVSNDGNFGFYIEQGNGRTTSNSIVDEEYVIEIHYLGDAVTSLVLDVTNISHTNTLDDLYYVEKGFIGMNIMDTGDGHRFGADGQISYSLNTDLDSSITSTIIQNGTSPTDTYWQVQQGGLDPIYGLVEIDIPNAGATEANGNRDHDYLYLESQLYFDVIQQDTALVESLQDLIDGTITLTDFAGDLDAATGSFSSQMLLAPNASNDTNFVVGIGTFINDIPHMLHFDHVNY